MDVTFGQRCGQKFHENVRKLECRSSIFVQNHRYLFLDEVLCIYYAMHSISFLVSPFMQSKNKMAARYFFNGEKLAKVVPT